MRAWNILNFREMRDFYLLENGDKEQWSIVGWLVGWPNVGATKTNLVAKRRTSTTTTTTDRLEIKCARIHIYEIWYVWQNGMPLCFCSTLLHFGKNNSSSKHWRTVQSTAHRVERKGEQVEHKRVILFCYKAIFMKFQQLSLHTGASERANGQTDGRLDGWSYGQTASPILIVIEILPRIFQTHSAAQQSTGIRQNAMQRNRFSLNT